MKTIYIDAMAEDKKTGSMSAEVAVRACLQAAPELPSFSLNLIGQQEALHRALNGNRKPKNIFLTSTEQFVEMDTKILGRDFYRNLSKTSVGCAAQKTVEHCQVYPDSAVMIGASNTGAMVLALNRCAKRHSNTRPFLCALMPCYPNRAYSFYLLADAGIGEVSLTSINAVQYATYCSEYLKFLGVSDKPYIGLLNMGTEDSKGGSNMIDIFHGLEHTFKRVQDGGSFYGNIEGWGALEGTVPILITGGFCGNVYLKSAEGHVRFVMEVLRQALHNDLSWAQQFLFNISSARSVMKSCTKKLDPSQYGGAPLFGYDILCYKVHGSGDDIAFYHGIKMAAKAVDDGLVTKINSLFTQPESIPVLAEVG